MKMKEHAMEQAGARALTEMLEQSIRDLRADRLERIERLTWEIKSATNDLLRELQALEADRAEEASRRADAEIKAGHNPF